MIIFNSFVFVRKLGIMLFYEVDAMVFSSELRSYVLKKMVTVSAFTTALVLQQTNKQNIKQKTGDLTLKLHGVHVSWRGGDRLRAVETEAATCSQVNSGRTPSTSFNLDLRPEGPYRLLPYYQC